MKTTLILYSEVLLCPGCQEQNAFTKQGVNVVRPKILYCKRSKMFISEKSFVELFGSQNGPDWREKANNEPMEVAGHAQNDKMESRSEGVENWDHNRALLIQRHRWEEMMTKLKELTQNNLRIIEENRKQRTDLKNVHKRVIKLKTNTHQKEAGKRAVPRGRPWNGQHVRAADQSSNNTNLQEETHLLLRQRENRGDQNSGRACENGEIGAMNMVKEKQRTRPN